MLPHAHPARRAAAGARLRVDLAAPRRQARGRSAEHLPAARARQGAGHSLGGPCSRVAGDGARAGLGSRPRERRPPWVRGRMQEGEACRCHWAVADWGLETRWSHPPRPAEEAAGSPQPHSQALSKGLRVDCEEGARHCGGREEVTEAGRGPEGRRRRPSQESPGGRGGRPLAGGGRRSPVVAAQGEGALRGGRRAAPEVVEAPLVDDDEAQGPCGGKAAGA